MSVYGTTWVGETYYRQDARTAAELRSATDPVGVLARKGSGALFLFSLISLAGSIILPWVVESPSDEDDPLLAIKETSEGFGRTLSLLRRYRVDITTAWGLSQVAFGASMILAPISRSFQFATILVALCGLLVVQFLLITAKKIYVNMTSRPWAMYGWAPLAIMGEEINKLESSANAATAYTRITNDGGMELSRPSIESSSLSEGSSNSVGMAGVYLGIWNIFATIPQFIATFIAMITFTILEPGKNSELSGGEGSGSGDEIVIQGLSGTAVCLAIGAVCSFVAATQSFRMRKF